MGSSLNWVGLGQIHKHIGLEWEATSTLLQ
jgi:hypothetical protein